MSPAQDPRPDTPLDEPAAFDRGISPISGPSPWRRGKALALGALMAGIAVLAAANGSPRPTAAAPPTERPTRQVVAYEPAVPAADPAPLEPAPDKPAPGVPEDLNVPSRIAAGTPMPRPHMHGVPALEPGWGAPPAAAMPAAAEEPAPLMVAGIRPVEPVAPAPGKPPGEAATPISAAAAELDGLRQASRISRASAYQVGDRNFLILAGASIPCVLQTALDSSTSGYASCVLPNDVYSDNGAVVLMEKGTRVLGEYRGGLRPGDRRVFVLWNRAVTPAGVAIDLASPASDRLGRSGFDGDLDTRFWDRFGAAALLSLVDDGAARIAVGGEAAELPGDAAAIAVDRSADLGPVLSKPQGSEVSIFAANDFDFSGVYALEAAEP